MRVNITYSVDLESVPTEVDKLMLDVQAALNEVQDLFDNTNSSSPLEAISDINNIREMLVSLDSRLGDCANILSGYMDVKTKIATGQDNPPTPLEVESDE
jgi:hypothetical protein